MSEVDALLKIAAAINGFSAVVSSIEFVLVLMLIFKDMGAGARDQLQKMNGR